MILPGFLSSPVWWAWLSEPLSLPAVVGFEGLDDVFGNVPSQFSCKVLVSGYLSLLAGYILSSRMVLSAPPGSTWTAQAWRMTQHPSPHWVALGPLFPILHLVWTLLWGRKGRSSLRVAEVADSSWQRWAKCHGWYLPPSTLLQPFTAHAESPPMKRIQLRVAETPNFKRLASKLYAKNSSKTFNLRPSPRTCVRGRKKKTSGMKSTLHIISCAQCYQGFHFTDRSCLSPFQYNSAFPYNGPGTSNGARPAGRDRV